IMHLFLLIFSKIFYHQKSLRNYLEIHFNYLLFANGLGYGTPINFTNLSNAAWLGAPTFTAPTFNINAMTLIAPVAIILVAENLGHVKAVGAITGRNLDEYLGRAFLGDGLATIVSASGGGTGVTTYARSEEH